VKEGRILIAEDEAIARDNLHYVLLKDGYNVVSVENGQLAIEELRKREFDLVMTDLKMQPVGGIEVLQTAKQLYPDIEVIVITGYATVQSAVQVRSAIWPSPIRSKKCGLKSVRRWRSGRSRRKCGPCGNRSPTAAVGSLS
jgi:CheY-like chemotaxis protein